MKDYFKKELIEINLDVKDSDQVIKHLGGILMERGFVKDSFIDAVIIKEKEFATGIPIEPMGIAIPHTDCEHVNKMAVAVGVLQKPIVFGVMGGEGKIKVDLVFLMAFKDCDAQISMLQSLCEFFQKEHEIEKIRNANNKEIIQNILNTELVLCSI